MRQLSSGERKVLDELISVEAKIEDAKALYIRRDELVEDFRELVRSKRVLYKGRIYQVVDNFKNKNVVWRATAVRRFELKVNDHDA